MTHRIVLVLAMGVACGAVANLVSPRRIPWFQEWSTYVADKAREEGLHVVNLEDMQRIVEQGTHYIFDARPINDYDAGSIPTALPLPYLEMEEMFEQYQALLTPEWPILVFCSGQECDESLLLGVFLRDQGFTNLYLFADGYGAWAKAMNEGEAP
jgi:rhodanese-related sulfurtransferase